MEGVWLAVAQQLGKMDPGHFVLLVVIAMMAFFIFNKEKDQRQSRKDEREDQKALTIALGIIADNMSKIREAIAANTGRTMQ